MYGNHISCSQSKTPTPPSLSIYGFRWGNVLASMDLKNFQYPFVKSLFPLKTPSGIKLHTSRVYITTENSPGQRLYCARIITKNLHYVAKIFAIGKISELMTTIFRSNNRKHESFLANTLFWLFLKLHENKPSISTGVPL